MLTHRVDGSGPPLVLLNGGFMSIGAWQPLLPTLTERYRIVRCDLRGQLLTPGPYATSWEDHASDVVALLDELQIDRAELAGTSFGAEVAMFVAAMHPERVARLIVTAATDYTTPAMRDDAREMRQLAEDIAAGRQEGAALFRRVFDATWSAEWVARQPDGFLEARMRLLVAQPPSYFEGAASLLALLESLDLRPYLARITAPALVIGGANDRTFPIAHSHAIAAAIPGARLEILADTGHGLIIERAERVVELIG